MPWKKGESGNPRGRPPKERALTEILERAGNRTVKDIDGHKRSGKRVVARMVWDLVTTGKAQFPDGGTLEIRYGPWLELVQWVFSQVDGPPKASLSVDADLTSGGQSLGEVLEAALNKAYGDDVG